MAWEAPGYKLPGCTAAADYRTTGQYLFVKITADDIVTKCSVAGERAVGVLQNAPNTGQEAEIVVNGVTKVVAGELLAAGDIVGTDSSGRAQKIEATATGADLGAWALGQVVEGAGAAGELVTILLGDVGYRVTA